MEQTESVSLRIFTVCLWFGDISGDEDDDDDGGGGGDDGDGDDDDDDGDTHTAQDWMESMLEGTTESELLNATNSIEAALLRLNNVQSQVRRQVTLMNIDRLFCNAHVIFVTLWDKKVVQFINKIRPQYSSTYCVNLF